MSERHGQDPGFETGQRQATAFTRVWYWAFLVMGFYLLSQSYQPLDPDLQASGIPWWQGVALVAYPIIISIFITVGAGLGLVGAMAGRWIVTDSWSYERTGALLGVAGWTARFLSLLFDRPPTIMGALFNLTVGVSLAVRWITLRDREKNVREAKAEMENS